ncbi:unnamed protein product [Cochlearia groenlandica]
MSSSSSASTMEVKIVKRSDLPPTSRFVNTIFIHINGQVNELVEDQNGIVTQTGSYTIPPHHFPPLIKLYPRDFTPQNIYRLLLQNFDQPCTLICETIANRIAYECDCLLPTGPFGLCFDVTLTRDVRIMLPSITTSLSEVASEHVLQRLSEEQRVNSLEKDETCSICMEDYVYESSSEKIIIRMPNCTHLFHQDCIFEWLKRRNSCPLCRKVPYEEEQETE